MVYLINALQLAQGTVLWGDPVKSTFTAFNQQTTANAVRSVASKEEAEKVLAIVATPLDPPWRWNVYFDGTNICVGKFAVCNAPGPGGKPS